jgi:NitT/TauT family transport system permease protein
MSVIPATRAALTRVGRASARPELILSPLVLVVALLIWTFVTETRMVSSILLPSPAMVAAGIGSLVTAEWFPNHLVTTAIEMVAGFSLASLGAFATGVILAHIPLVRRVLYPYLVVFQVMPMVVLAPVIVIWFGFGIESKVVVAVTTAFFVVLVNTLAGIDRVPRNSQLLMRSLVASRRQEFVMLTLPASLPYVFAGLKTAATLALIGALVGEFVTARAGLGRLLTQFSFALKQDLVFATVFVVGALGVVMYGAVALLERRIVWWKT